MQKPNPIAIIHHYCCILHMEPKAVGPVCCVMNVKEPSALLIKSRGFALVFLV